MEKITKEQVRSVLDEAVAKFDYKFPEYDGVGGVKIQHGKQVIFMNAEYFNEEMQKRCKV